MSDEARERAWDSQITQAKKLIKELGCTELSPSELKLWRYMFLQGYAARDAEVCVWTEGKVGSIETFKNGQQMQMGSPYYRTACGLLPGRPMRRYCDCGRRVEIKEER